MVVFGGVEGREGGTFSWGTKGGSQPLPAVEAGAVEWKRSMRNAWSSGELN